MAQAFQHLNDLACWLEAPGPLKGKVGEVARAYIVGLDVSVHDSLRMAVI